MTGSIFGALLIVNRGRLFGPSVVSSLLPGLSSSSISSLSVYHALALAALGYLTGTKKLIVLSIFRALAYCVYRAAGVHVSYDHLRRWLLHKDQPWQKRIDKRLRPVIAALFCALAAVYGYPQHLSSGFGQLAGLMRGQQGSGLGLATAFTVIYLTSNYHSCYALTFYVCIIFVAGGEVSAGISLLGDRRTSGRTICAHALPRWRTRSCLLSLFGAPWSVGCDCEGSWSVCAVRGIGHARTAVQGNHHGRAIHSRGYRPDSIADSSFDYRGHSDCEQGGHQSGTRIMKKSIKMTRE